MIICIILLYRIILCNLHSAILLLFLSKDSNNDALCPVLSPQCICRIAAMTMLGKIYCVICIKSTGEHVIMATKPHTHWGSCDTLELIEVDFIFGMHAVLDSTLMSSGAYSFTITLCFLHFR